MNKSSFTTRLVTLAFLIALEVILTRFLSIQLPIARIGFGFLPVAVMAILYGPVWAGLGYVAGDLLGMLLFPTGPYFPGFTLTAFLTGATYGIFLYKKTMTWQRILVTVITVVVLYTIFLNTVWLHILYGKAFLGLMPSRLIQAAIMIPVQFLTIHLIAKGVLPRIAPRVQQNGTF